MKRIKRKITIGLFLIIGLVSLCVSFFNSGKENIQEHLNEALNKTIIVDFHRRELKEMRYTGKSLNKKVDRIKITSNEGPEYIIFEDSVEEYLAYQWATQYILAQIRPVNPDKFNTLFNEEISKKNIICRTGIIYRHKGDIQYSDKDSISYQKSIATQAVILDAKKTVTVQAWADCDRATIWKNGDKRITWLAVFYLIIATFVFSHSQAKQINTENVATNSPTVPTNVFMQKGIKVDEKERKIYINDQECVTMDSGFKIMRLLIGNPKHFVSKEEIVQELWPVEINSTDKNILNNRINKHINTLRKALLNFPEYQIKTEHGKGYRLLIPSSLTPYAP